MVVIEIEIFVLIKVQFCVKEKSRAENRERIGKGWDRKSIGNG